MVEKSCGAVVYKKEGKIKYYLLIQHNQNLGDHWDFPKGHIEANETETETARREVLEETNLSIDFVGDFRRETKYMINRETSKISVYYLAKAVTLDVRIQKEEIQRFLWLPFEEAKEILTFRSQKKILEDAKKNLIDE